MVDGRERRVQCRLERERARRDSETAKQREERLRKQRMRDRARRAAQTGMMEWKMEWISKCMQLQLTRVTGAAV